jgi:hypothetical protein
MIKKGNLLGAKTTDSITVSGTYVVTNITIVNISNHSNQFSIFRTPASEVSVNGVFQDDCRIYKNILIDAGDTTTFSVKWVISDGDAVGISKTDGATGRDLIYYIDGVFVG